MVHSGDTVPVTVIVTPYCIFPAFWVPFSVAVQLGVTMFSCLMRFCLYALAFIALLSLIAWLKWDDIFYLKLAVCAIFGGVVVYMLDIFMEKTHNDRK